MFFMGEEIGAQKALHVRAFSYRTAKTFSVSGPVTARRSFASIKDLITLSRRLRSIRSQNIDILHQSNANRVIAFKRWSGDEEVIIVASLNNTPFANGYVIEKDLLAIPNGGWKEIFNSDAASYGGQNVGNRGAVIPSNQGRLDVVIPASGFVVFAKAMTPSSQVWNETFRSQSSPLCRTFANQAPHAQSCEICPLRR